MRNERQIKNTLGLCAICNSVHTSNHVEVEQDSMVYVCSGCVEKAIDNFIWICLSCGKSFIKPKQLVIHRVKDRELKRAYMLCQDLLIIQGIESCISCHPERIVEYMETLISSVEC